MKKSLVIIVMLLVYGALFSSTQAESYETYQIFVDPNFLSMTFYTMVVDPGHGGPRNGGGRKYGENGDGHGAYGYYDSLSEQWANLGVGFCLRDSLTQPGWWQQTVLMTRETQYNPDTTYIAAMWHRVQCGNYGNNGFPVSGECISIHFNGLTPEAHQRTETWMSRYEQTDSGYYKVIAPKLSQKIVSSNHWNMNRFYPCIDSDPCYECYRDGGVKYEGEGPNEKKFVLRNWIPASTLVECSDISYDGDEEDFLEDSLGCHTELIAAGIYWGWQSYKNNSGILTVKNISVDSDGNDGFFYVTHDGIEVSVNSPFVVVAPEGTQWRIDFVSPQIIGEPPAKPYFAHSVIECGDQLTLYDNTQSITYTVPNCSTHEITAYYTGGPYGIDLNYPNGGEVWWICDSKTIAWKCSSGVDSTSKVDILISRDEGSTWNTIATNLPFNRGYSGGYSHYTWLVTGVSEHCKIKTVAHDIAGNEAEDISNEFAIRFLSQVVFPNGGEQWEIGKQEEISWMASGGEYTRVDIWLSRDGGSTWEVIAENIRNDYYSYKWTPTGATSEHCKIKIRAHWGNDEAFDVSDNEFAIRYLIEFVFPRYDGTPLCIGWPVMAAYWRVSPGEGRNHVSVYLDRNDGNDGFPEGLPSYISHTPYWFCVYWPIVAPTSDSCRLKVTSYDDAGHQAIGISNRFRIYDDCVKGDVNLDGAFYTVGDIELLAHAVVHGEVVFWNLEKQREASDANCDGRPCLLADVIYMCKVAAGDIPPCELLGWTGGFGNRLTGGGTVLVTASYRDDKTTISTTSNSQIAGILLECENQTGNPVVFSFGDMEKMYNNKKVLMYDKSGGRKSIPAGTHELFTIEGVVRLKSVSAADPQAREMKIEIINQTDSSLPSEITLFPNYPNPFNPYTNISFNLPNAMVYTLKIYNVTGQLVRSYAGIGSVGLNVVAWDGRDDYGNGVASGIYFYKLEVGAFRATRKMVLLR